MNDNKILTIEEIKKGINDVLDKYPKYKDIQQIILFGSYVKNMANENSDINVCIVVPKSYSVAKQFGLEYHLEQYFNKSVNILNLNDALREDKNLYDKVKNDGILVFSCNTTTDNGR